MKNNTLQQLKNLKNETSAGFVSESDHLVARENLMKAIGNNRNQNESWSISSVFDLTRFIVSETFSKPSIALTSVLFIIFGSITTVSASVNSLPGDPLYGVKVVTERAQLQLSSQSRRATLHTEFAERRLQELLEISNQYPDRPELLSSVAQAYRRELASIANQVENNKPNTISEASQIDSRLSSLSEKAGNQTENEIAQTLSQETKATSNRVIDQVITINESTETSTEVSRRSAQELFTSRYNDVNNRRTMSLGRISVLESHPASEQIISNRELLTLKNSIRDLDKLLGESLNLAASGGFRAAFENVNNVNQELLGLEAQLTTLEEALIKHLNPPEEELIDPALETITDQKADSNSEIEYNADDL